MKTHYHDKTLPYDGSQLRAHFAYETFGVTGDSIIAFRGPCHVEGKALVDLEDQVAKLFIHSEDMLHFIIEHFDDNLDKVIAWQRLFVSCIIEELHSSVEDLRLQRKGDDIYDDDAKLSVSIATRSAVSCLIHTGINVSSKNTPITTKGLDDYELNPHALARGAMNRYQHEIEDMRWARAKVRGV
jgi:hypothetical protein